MPGILIVGAGFAGAVYARTLAEAGYTVHVIDRRDHIARQCGGLGRCQWRAGASLRAASVPHQCDAGVRLAAALRGLDAVSAPGAGDPAGRAVRAAAGQSRYHRRGVRRDAASEPEAADFLRGVAVPIADPANAGEHLRSRIGDVLTDLFFRPYTRKMWGLELEEMDASVVKRLPIRFDSNDLYFPG